MKLPRLDVKDVDTKQLIIALQNVLSNISTDNMRLEQIEGTTDGSADTERQFRYNFPEVPKLWLTLEGDVYIPRHGIKESFIDIRSTKTSEEFRLLLIF